MRIAELDRPFTILTIRVLAIVSLCSYLIWLFYRLFFYEGMPPNLQHVIQFDGIESVVPSTNYTYIVFLVLSLVSYVGIFFNRLWGMKLLLALYAATLFLSLLSGAQVHVPVERFFYNVLLLSDGMMIGIAMPALVTRKK